MRETMTVTVPAELREQAKIAAIKHRTNVSELIAAALVRYLRRLEEDEAAGLDLRARAQTRRL